MTEPLYTLPTATREARRSALLSLVLAALLDVVVALWLASQYLAFLWRYSPRLGPPLVTLPSYPNGPAALLAGAALLGAIGAVLVWPRSLLLRVLLPLMLPIAGVSLAPAYLPWAYLSWSSRYGSVEALRPQLGHAELVFVASLAALLASTAVAVRGRLRELHRTGDVHGSGRFAVHADVEAAGLLKDKPGVILAGWTMTDGTRRYLCDSDDRHVLIYAPPGAGKSSSLTIPTLLTWPGSAVVLDIKGELWKLTAGFRHAALDQQCIRLELSASDGTSARYNPLVMIPRGEGDVIQAQELAELLINPDGRELSGDPFWRNAAQHLLTGVFLHTLYVGPRRTLAACAHLLTDPDRPVTEVLEAMLSAQHDPAFECGFKDAHGRPSATHPVVAASARFVLDMHERTRSGVIAQALAALALFYDPILAANTAECDFRPEDLMDADRPVTLYLVLPLDDVARLQPVVRAFLTQTMRRLTHRLELDPVSLKPTARHDLLLILDELFQLGRLDFFQRALGLVRGYGIRAVIAVQALSQLLDQYGSHQSVTSNCRTQVAYAAADLETARALSQLSGTRTVTVERESRSGGVLALNPGRGTYTLADNARPLLTIDEARRLPTDRCLVFVAGHPPILAERCLYWMDPVLRERAAYTPPPSGRIPHRLGDWTDHSSLPAPLSPIEPDSSLSPEELASLSDELPPL